MGFACHKATAARKMSHMPQSALSRMGSRFERAAAGPPGPPPCSRHRKRPPWACMRKRPPRVPARRQAATLSNRCDGTGAPLPPASQCLRRVHRARVERCECSRCTRAGRGLRRISCTPACTSPRRPQLDSLAPLSPPASPAAALPMALSAAPSWHAPGQPLHRAAPARVPAVVAPPTALPALMASCPLRLWRRQRQCSLQAVPTPFAADGPSFWLPVCADYTPARQSAHVAAGHGLSAHSILGLSCRRIAHAGDAAHHGHHLR